MIHSTPDALRRLGFVVLSIALSSSMFAQHSMMQPSAKDVVVPVEGESVPMLEFGGRPVIEVMINGKGPYRFIFDTGAMFSVIDSKLAEELSLGDNSEIEQLKMGRAAIFHVHAVVNPISKLLGGGDVPRGVLSASWFPGNLVTFDYPAKRIAFRAGALAAANHTTIFDYDPADLPSVPVKVAGREFTVHLDTGAPLGIALPTKYIKELPLKRPAVQKGIAKTHGGSLPIFVAPLDGEMSIGNFKLPMSDLRFTDVVPFPGREPKGQVGDEVLKEFVVTLDSSNHRIEFGKISQTKL
jgi:Aspartyl protease